MGLNNLMKSFFRLQKINSQKYFCSTKNTDALNQLLKKLETFKNISYFPVTKYIETETLDDILKSKFCGMPFIPKDQNHPECEFCKKKLQLFLQLNTNDMPQKIEYISLNKLMQIFYCVNEDCTSFVNYEAFTFGSVVRNVIQLDQKNEANIELIKKIDFTNQFKAKHITGWTQKPDYPHIDDWDGLGDENLGQNLTNDLTEQVADQYEQNYPLKGDKLLGYPCWVQGAELPNCTVCLGEMSYLLQIDSQNNIPYMFGDFGRAYLCYCPQHPHIISFGWQSN